MSGTITGGKKCAATNKKLHGNGYYARIGAMGGKNGHTGGFAANHELARLAGSKGGRISKRGKAKPKNVVQDYEEVEDLMSKAEYDRLTRGYENDD